MARRPRRAPAAGLALAGPLIGIFAMAADASAANVALAGIQADLGASTAGLQGVLGAYMVAVAATVIAVSRAGDILGRRRVFAYGLVAFGLGSLACGLAPDVPALVAGRIVQGVGGGAVYALSLALITGSRPKDELARGVAAWSVAAGLAMSVAPLLGGALITAFDWRAVFLVNVPVVAGALALTIALLPESRDRKATRRVDLPGAATLTTGLAALMVAIVQAPEWGWASPATLGLLVAGVAALGAFVAIERRSRDPLIDLRLFFANRRFVAANALALPAYGAIYVVLFLMPLFQQNVQGHSAAEAGLRLLPFPVLFFVLSRPAGRLVARAGALWAMGVGCGLMVAALLMLSFAEAGTGEPLLAVAFALLGAGQAYALVGISAAALGALPPSVAGAASGIRSTSSWGGGALWVALAGAILTALERSRLDDAPAVGEADADAFVFGMSWVLRGCGIVLALAAVGTALLYRSAGGEERRAAPPREHSPLHPHPPAWATLRGRDAATEESA
jgi:EmrB/QacA subfamily drug resistance transporter